MKLSKYFTLEEMIYSQTAERQGIDNTPAPEIVSQLSLTAQGMDQIEDLLGFHPLTTSGYRCDKLNAAVGGAQKSQHKDGKAEDFICPQFGPPMEIAVAVRDSDIDFDQLIMEGTWVHVSFNGDANRRQCLTAHFGPDGTTYTEGF